MQIKPLNSFVGCNPQNKSVTSTESYIYYAGSTNLIQMDSFGVTNIKHFDSKIICINSNNTQILVGEESGKCHILDDNLLLSSFQLDSKIFDSVLLNERKAIFITLKSINLVNFDNFAENIFLKTYYLINSIQTASESRIITGDINGNIYLYILSNGIIEFLSKTNAHTDAIKDIKINSDGFLATCSQDRNIKIWKLLNNKFEFIQTINGHTDWVNEVAWNGLTLLSASSDKTIRAWESKTAESNFVFTKIFGHSSPFLGVTIFNGIIFGNTKSGGIDKVENNEYFISGHLNEITDIDFKVLEGSPLILSSSLDKTSRMYFKGKEIFRPQIHGWPIASIKFLKNERIRIVSAGSETILRIYEATKEFFVNANEALETAYDDNEFEFEKSDFALNNDFLEKGDFTLNNDFLENSQANNKIDYAETAILSELNLTNTILNDFEPQNISENNLNCRVFNEINKIYGHFFDIKSLAVTSKYIFSCNLGSLNAHSGIFVWDSDSGKKLQYLPVHDLGIQKLVVNKAENRLLAVSRDKSISLYSINEEKLLKFSAEKNNSILVLENRFFDNQKAVLNAEFSNCGEYFATCARDGRVILYKNSKIVSSAEFEDAITCMCFSESSEILICGSLKGKIYILDYSLKIIQSFRFFGRQINCIKIHENLLIAGGADGMIRIFKIY